MGIMITYHGYNDPMYNGHKNVGAHSYTAKYGTSLPHISQNK